MNGITLEELLVWNDEASAFWKAHLDANPSLLELPCDIGGSANVQEFVRHIWTAELRWAQRLANLPVIATEDVPAGPLDVLFDLHRAAVEVFRTLLELPPQSWEETYVLDLKSIPPEARKLSRRKVAVHALLHSQRHWAQLSTLTRVAGFPSSFRGDCLFSSALK
jgi:hypothetical protein